MRIRRVKGTTPIKLWPLPKGIIIKLIQNLPKKRLHKNMSSTQQRNSNCLLTMPEGSFPLRQRAPLIKAWTRRSSEQNCIFFHQHNMQLGEVWESSAWKWRSMGETHMKQRKSYWHGIIMQIMSIECLPFIQKVRFIHNEFVEKCDGDKTKVNLRVLVDLWRHKSSLSNQRPAMMKLK